MAAPYLGNSFDMGVWHAPNYDDDDNVCGTTCCRAGVACLVAGKSGLDLARETDWDHAADLIYAASYPGRELPDFYTTTGVALADIRERASRASLA